MRSHDELARIARDPAIRRLAMRRADSRELAEDALQESYWNVARQDLEIVADVRAYFTRALLREINRQRTRPGPTLVGDITSDGEADSASSIHGPPESVERQAELLRLAQAVLAQLHRNREELMNTVPRRSPDQRRYRSAIVAAAGTIFLMLLQSAVASADWNAALRSAYSPWFAEAGLAPDAADQRLSRGRYDVRCLLQRLVPRERLV
jgi:DNA-directed RNA polymerase specialized sigma24 family protein